MEVVCQFEIRIMDGWRDGSDEYIRIYQWRFLMAFMFWGRRDQLSPSFLRFVNVQTEPFSSDGSILFLLVWTKKMKQYEAKTLPSGRSLMCGGESADSSWWMFVSKKQDGVWRNQTAIEKYHREKREAVWFSRVCRIKYLNLMINNLLFPVVASERCLNN